MDAVSRTAACAVEDLDRVLATLGRCHSPGYDRRLDTALFTIESARELLCDAREVRAVQLLRHARRVLAPVFGAEAGADENGMAVTRHLDNAIASLGHTVN
jgi:hypothetical protein